MKNNYTCWEINGHSLEFLDDIHQYIVDGVCVPSVTQVIRSKFAHKYDWVNEITLRKASDKGTETHKAIEDYCKEGKESDLPEVRNFKFLQKKFEFEVMANEVPVILFQDGEPIYAGRLDLVLTTKEGLTIADIKRTSTLDKEYLGYQLNLYRIAYQQCYQKYVNALKGIHLREDVRKFVDIPVKPTLVFDLLSEWKEKNS